MKKFIALVLAVLMLTVLSVSAFADSYDQEDKYVCISNYSDYVIEELYITTSSDDDSAMENILEDVLNPDGAYFEAYISIFDDDYELNIAIVDDERTCTEFYLNPNDYSEFTFYIVTTDDYSVCLADTEGNALKPDFVCTLEEADSENELIADYEPDNEMIYIQDEESVKYRYENVNISIVNYLKSDITSVYVKPSNRDYWSGNMIRNGYYIPVGSNCYLDGTIWYDEDCKWDLYIYTRTGWFSSKNISFEGVSNPCDITIAVYSYSDGSYDHEVY